MPFVRPVLAIALALTVACGAEYMPGVEGLGGRPPATSADAGSLGETTHDAGPSDAGKDAATELGDAGDDTEEGVDGSASPTVVVPVTIAQGPTIKVSFGGGPEVDCLLDTGSSGVWVIPDAIPAGGAVVSDSPIQTVYGARLKVAGVAATTTFAVAGVTSVPITVGYQQLSSCLPGQQCPQLSQETFFGAYKAVIGVGLRGNANALDNPFTALTLRSRWIVSLGDTDGTVTLNPGSLAQRFGSIVQLTPSAQNGWDDTQVPFCANQLCGNALLDSGNSSGILITAADSDYDALGVPEGAAIAPPGTALDFTVNTTQTFSLTVGTPPTAGTDLFQLKPQAVSNNLGLMVFRHLDVFFDGQNGHVGLASKL